MDSFTMLRELFKMFVVSCEPPCEIRKVLTLPFSPESYGSPKTAQQTLSKPLACKPEPQSLQLSLSLLFVIEENSPLDPLTENFNCY